MPILQSVLGRIRSLVDLIPTFFDEPDVTRYMAVGESAGGGDENVYVLRSHVTAQVVGRNRSNDTMTNVTEIQRIMEERPTLEARNIFIDDIGIGRGVTDRLKELGIGVNGVSVGSPAQDTTKYANIKAESYWNTARWIQEGGALVRGDGWTQLPWIKYKVSSDKVIQIEPKQQLKALTGKSPDVAEALMLTHCAADQEAFVVVGE